MRIVLLTGVTGVVGSSLLEELIKKTDDQIYLLIRKKNDYEVHKRFYEVLEFLEIAKTDFNIESRIILLEGDVTLPQLGLSKDIWLKLSSCLDHIFHSAASVELHTSIEVAKQNSLLPTQNILKLLRKANESDHKCGLEYVSTVGILGKLNEPLTEYPVTQLRTFHNNYEAAKAEAEVLIYQAQNEGYSIHIHRPSMVVGNSQTGHIIHHQIFYFILRFILGRFTFGMMPILTDVKLDTIPSDIVAQIILTTSYDKDNPKLILNLCSGSKNSVSLLQLQKSALNLISKFKLKNTLPLRNNEKQKSKHSKRTSSLSPVFKKPVIKLSFLYVVLQGMRLLMPKSATLVRVQVLKNILEYAQTQQNFSNIQTQVYLSKSNLSIPPSESYLTKVLEVYFEKSGCEKN